MTRDRCPLYCPAPQSHGTGFGGAGQTRLPTPEVRREGPDAELEGRLVGVLGSRRGLTEGREGPGAGLEGLLVGALGLRRGPMADREGPGSAASPKPSGSCGQN